MSDIPKEGILLPVAGEKAGINPPVVENKPFFEFRDVCKAFDDHVVLNDVSFTVKRRARRA